MAHEKPTRTTDHGRQAFWQRNPSIFAKQMLGVDLWKKQREVLDALSKDRFVAVRSCNGSGKTFTAALATIWWLMSHREGIVITTAPTQRQVKQNLWREIKKFHFLNRDLIGGKLSSTQLELSNERYAFGFSTDTTDRFQGFHHQNILVIVDEAAGVKESIFDAILGTISSANARMLMIGNPNHLSGTFYDAFHKNRDSWHTVHISAFDTPAFDDRPEDTEPLPPGISTRDWEARIAKNHGKDSHAYQVRILGDFPSDHDDTLIALKHIEAAVDRSVETSEDHETVMGLDIARFGNSKTVAAIRRGPKVLELSEFRKSDLMRTTGSAIDLARKHDVKTIHIDEVGLGAGVVDRLYEIDDVYAIGVNVGKKADDPERYADLRAQMFDGLRERFADGDISIPDDPELISQLASATYRYTSRGQLKLQSKDEIRATGRQSPDKADALALAFARNLYDKNRLMIWT